MDFDTYKSIGWLIEKALTLGGFSMLMFFVGWNARSAFARTKAGRWLEDNAE